MANTVSSFYQTLVAAATEATQVLVGTTNLLESVYRDFEPVAESPGRVLNIVLPGSVGASGPADVGVGDFTTSDISFSTVALTFNQHPGYAFVVRDFEQYNSPERIRSLFLDGAIKGMAEYVNAAIAALITSANFSTYSVVNDTAPGSISQSGMTKAWGNLATGKVPVRDLGNFFLATHPNVYGNMLGSTFWAANSQVGYQLAGSTRRGAMLGQQFGAFADFDQQMPATIGAAVTGTSVGVTNASTAVTGSGTAFTTQLKVGQYLVFANDTTATPYQIVTISSNTALVLGTAYAGTTNASTQATVTSYTSLLFHRHAIALAVRPLPEPDGKVVDYTYVDYKGVPIRVMVAYNQLKGGFVVTLDAGYALGVVRPDHGQIVLS